VDNFTIDLTCEGRDEFQVAMKLAWRKYNKATHYLIDQKAGMVLFWLYPQNGAQPLPYAMNADAAIPFVWNWLESADRGPQPGHDGHNGKGWRLHATDWGHVEGFGWSSMFAVQPIWAMYGK
jgi:hypothetical protein